MPNAPKVVPLKPRSTPPPRTSTTARGYGHAHQKARAARLARFPTCERCGDRWSKHLHHIDRDTSNRADSNLEALCGPCHQLEHSAG